MPKCDRGTQLAVDAGVDGVLAVLTMNKSKTQNGEKQKAVGQKRILRFWLNGVLDKMLFSEFTLFTIYNSRFYHFSENFNKKKSALRVR